MQRLLRVDAVFERHGAWYIGYVPTVPGVNSQERTLKQARASLAGALRELAEMDAQALTGSHRRIEQLSVQFESRTP
ncbi:MAG: type II toxin-antitoxin system HicB family antitoxin [Planctomycetes bacterium]|nr:type II toxin-antitoxin system HicB family antitoxin [Planctomycetota bacterium]